MKAPLHLLPAVLTVGLLLAGPGVALAKEAQQTPEEEQAPPELVGFKLGDFYIKNFRPAEGAKTKLTFTLHAAVWSDKADQFEGLLENRTARIRDQVITSARMSEASVYRDPELRLFRRRILIRIRRAMPSLPIEEIYLSDFRYFVE